MPLEISVRFFEPEHAHLFAELFDVVWPDQAPFGEMAEWALRRNPLGCAPAVGAVDNSTGRLVGSRPAIYWPIVTKQGAKVRFYQFGGTCVHPQYRRLGLFRRMNELFLSAAERSREAGIFNVSVNESRLGYQKQGWQYLPGLRRYLLIPSSRRFIAAFVASRGRIRGGAVEERPIQGTCSGVAVDEEFSLMMAHKQGQLVEFHRPSYEDIPFARWRFSRNDRSYGEIRAKQEYLCIYKRLRRRAFREVMIGDMWLKAIDRGAVRRVVAKLCEKERPDVVSVCLTRGHPYRAALTAAGFWPDPKGDLLFGFRALREDRFGLGDPDSWALMTGDIDTF